MAETEHTSKEEMDKKTPSFVDEDEQERAKESHDDRKRKKEEKHGKAHHEQHHGKHGHGKGHGKDQAKNKEQPKPSAPPKDAAEEIARKPEDFKKFWIEVFEWKNLKVSLPIFAAINIAFFMIRFKNYSFLSLLFYAVFWNLVAAAVLKGFTSLTQREDMLKTCKEDFLTSDEAKQYIEVFRVGANAVIREAKYAVSFVDVKHSVLILFSSYLMALILRSLSFDIALYLTLMSSFVLVRRREQIPVWKSNIVSFVKALYERHLKAHVDNAYKKTSHFVDRVKEKVLHAKTKSD